MLMESHIKVLYEGDNCVAEQFAACGLSAAAVLTLWRWTPGGAVQQQEGDEHAVQEPVHALQGATVLCGGAPGRQGAGRGGGRHLIPLAAHHRLRRQQGAL